MNIGNKFQISHYKQGKEKILRSPNAEQTKQHITGHIYITHKKRGKELSTIK